MKKSRYILIGALLAMACIITTCYFQMERDNINDWAGDNYVPEYPTPGFRGVITFTDIFSTSLTVNWTKASDLETAESLLQYKLVRSLSNNITTVSDAEANGTLVMDWTADTTSINVTGLTMGYEYYFNILVRDEYGNTSAYTSSFLILNPIPEEVKRLIASDGEADDWFGACEISSDGSTIVVGANGDDVEGKDDHGSAYVFVKPEGGWGDVTGYAAKLIPSDGEIGDRFAYTGLSTSSDGSTISFSASVASA